MYLIRRSEILRVVCRVPDSVSESLRVVCPVPDSVSESLPMV